jgi:hypothetical protein
MPQIFPRSANYLAKASIFGAVLVVAGLGLTVFGLVRSPYLLGTTVTVEQPIPFSHKHHVGDVGLDCRYCHTAVEESAFAGIPPTKTCMNCHTQLFADSTMLEPVRQSFRTGEPIVWNRVHRLAGFVYFNHSIHVNKGVGCETCHGRVDTMPLIWQEATLQMNWCLECHRQPERFVRPRQHVFTMGYRPPADQPALGRTLVKEYNIGTPMQLTSCSTCHR